MKVKVLITGGLGYIGANTANLLKSNGFDVFVIDESDNENNLLKIDNVQYYQINLLDSNKLETIIKTISPDFIIHMAAKVSVFESTVNQQKYYENNVIGTKNLLKSLANIKIKGFLFSSTAAVYGNPKLHIVDENTDCNPVNPYGETKLINEKEIVSFFKDKNISYIIFRFFNVAGANANPKLGISTLEPTHIIPSAIKSVLENQEFCVFGDTYETVDGSCVRDYLHVWDIANAHLLAINLFMQKNTVKEVLNLGSNRGYSVLEIANYLKNKHGMKYKIKNARSGDPACLIANANKAFNILNWKSTKSLSEIIDSELEWRKFLYSLKND